MTQKEDKWIRQLRKSMDGYSEPLPDGMWKRIEADLPTRKVVPLWRTRSFAAAVAAVLVLSSMSVWFLRSSQAEYIKEESAVAQQLQPAIDDADITAGERTSVLPREEKIVSAQVPVRKASRILPLQEAVSMESAAAPLAVEEAISEVPDTTVAPRMEETSAKRAEARRRMEADRRTMERNRLQAEAGKSPRKAGSWSVGIAAGNTPYASSGSTGVSGMASRSLQSNGTVANVMGSEQEADAEYIGKDTQADVHHKVPLSVGASLAFHLDDEWAIETGLYYTYLASTLNLKNYAQEKVEQKLHYVGIPLKIYRSMWRNRWLDVYTSAGVMVEKCVKGTQDISSAVNDRYRELTQGGTVFSMTTGIPNQQLPRSVGQEGDVSLVSDDVQTDRVEVTARPWQVSALWSVGAQVRLAKRLGLYVEPGVAYYFDDKSGLYTVRKEHPFNFNLQMGLRFHVTK